MRTFSVFFCVLLAGMGIAAGQPQPSGTAAPRRTPGDAKRLIGPEDTVTISALNAEEISKAWRVSQAGILNLPMIGKIQATGMTVEQLEGEITKRLARYVKEPQATVFVSESRSNPVTVTGAVGSPGVIQIEGPSSLYSVIVKAGGPKEAGQTVTVTRLLSGAGPIPHPMARNSDDTRYSVVDLELKEVLSGIGPDANLQVQPLDQIQVATGKHQRMVLVSGEVMRGGAIELVTSDTISSMKAIALAGGLSRTAQPSKAVVRHLNAQGIETSVAFVDLKKIMRGQAKDIELSEGDILIVPNSNLSAYLQQATQAGFQTGFLLLGRF